MTGFHEEFRIHKWKWYLIDLGNWHEPVVVRKHFDNKKQADSYNKKYGSKRFHSESGIVCQEMGLRDWIKKDNEHRHKLSRYSKYEFPPHVKTQRQKQIFRDAHRRKKKRKKHRPMINYKILKELLDHKEMLFFKRLKAYSGYYTAYLDPIKGFHRFKEAYEYPYDVVNLSAITLCLAKYYDLGPYNITDVSIYIYEILREKVIKWRVRPDMSFKNIEHVKAEFLARGFIPKKDSGFKDLENSFVETIYVKPTLVYPEEAWFLHADAGIYDHNVYELQGLVGIPGYTRAATVDDNIG